MKMPLFLCGSARAAVLLALQVLVGPFSAHAGGVTLITHGLNGNVNGWVTGMANEIPSYLTFPGTNYTCYEAYLTNIGGTYFLTAARTAGAAPSATDSGEIIVKLDWSQIADGNSYNTYQVAAIVLPALLNTNFVSELGGHALAEMPLHLVGHSRGGSLICELSRLLGTNGIWVDHLTTLDPHPLNNDGFNLDHFIYSAVDAPAATYANVLFHDNYWENNGFPIDGEAVAGAYVRQLTSLSGGYSGSAGPHSDTHLWYHGTIDWRTPTTDTEASLTATERTNWWVAAESNGVTAGFQYSLIGGSNRLGTNRPVGAGFPAIRDGYNQNWDLGAGVSANRTLLTTNNGNWPSLIKLDRANTNQVVPGQSISVNLYYQWAQPAGSNATISFYLDDDPNPFNSNQKLLKQTTVPGTGAATFIGMGNFSLPLAASNASPGWHSLFAVINGGGQTRYLYAPERVLVVANTLTLDLAQINASQFRIGVNGLIGQTLVLQTSSNLTTWQPLATNTLATNRWVYTNSIGGTNRLFYRAVLGN
jgi:hypothetical protein